MKRKFPLIIIITLLALLCISACDNNASSIPSDKDSSEGTGKLALQRGIYLELVDGEYYISEVNENEWDSTEIVIKDKYKDGKPVVGIKELAFFGTGVTSVSIPNTIRIIERAAFTWCSFLTKIVIESDEISIGDTVFAHCANLKDIILNSKKVSIGEGAFYLCTPLPKFEIKCDEIKIGRSAFAWCKTLAEVYIVANKVTIDDNAFDLCESLRDVAIKGDVESIGASVFSLFDPEVGCKTNVAIYGNVNTIGRFAFQYCEDVAIYGNVNTIGDSAFYGVRLLDNVFFLGDVISIGATAFYGCSNLKCIKIPESITFIGRLAFSDCSNLTDIYYSGTIFQWNQIEIDDRLGLDSCIIHCTDGDIVYKE